MSRKGDPRPRRSAPGLKQIAEEAGVSLITVSRVVRGLGNVAPDTAAKIKKAIDRLKYRPNRLVHAIQSGRSGTIGVVVPIASWFQAQMISGIHHELADHSYLPVLHFPKLSPGACREEAERLYLHRLLDQRVDGIIFWPSDEMVSDAYLHEVWDRGVPLVAVDRHLPKTNADFAGTDDVAGGRLAAEHLLDLGHRRIAHLGGDPWVSTYSDRRAGFEAVAQSRADVSIRVAACSLSESYDLAMDMLTGSGRPTAIFAASDNFAMRIYAVATRLGIRIGEDLSVVGFADLVEAQRLQPGLTTIRQNPTGIGAAAARLILERLEGRVGSKNPRSVRLVPELVVRDSTVAAPAT